MFKRNLWLSLTSTNLLFAICLSKTVYGEPDVKSDMSQILAAMMELLPQAVSRSGLKAGEPANTKALQQLVAASDTLDTHAKSAKPGFRYLAKSLAKDTSTALKLYSDGRTEEATFFVRQMTEACFSCHTSNPDAKQSKAGEQLLKSVNVSKLQPLERAKLEVVSRQFDAALDTLEGVLLTDSVGRNGLVLLNPYVDYLTIAVRMKGDMSRVQKFLNTALSKPNLPLPVRMDLQSWQTSSQLLASPPDLKKTHLAAAREVMDKAKLMMEYPLDQAGLVHFLVASRILYLYLESDPKDPKMLAETYYLLGKIELMVSRSYWLSQADAFLQASVETAPGSLAATQAYALLEENLQMEFTGSSGMDLPNDVKRRLRELKSLMLNAEKEKPRDKT